MKGVQCYELFGGIALKNHAFSFFFRRFLTSTATAILVSAFVLSRTIRPISLKGIVKNVDLPRKFHLLPSQVV